MKQFIQSTAIRSHRLQYWMIQHTHNAQLHIHLIIRTASVPIETKKTNALGTKRGRWDVRSVDGVTLWCVQRMSLTKKLWFAKFAVNFLHVCTVRKIVSKWKWIWVGREAVVCHHLVSHTTHGTHISRIGARRSRRWRLPFARKTLSIAYVHHL